MVPMSRFLLLAAGVGAVGVLAACNDPLANQNRVAVQDDTVTVFAISGSPVSFPSALDIGSHTIVRVDETTIFDVAFDIDASGRVVVLPVQLVRSGVPTTSQAGVQVSSTEFASLTSAPNGGYHFDSTAVVRPGGVVVVQSQPTVCSLQVSRFEYAKIGVLSADTQTRLIRLAITVDPNCGFHSFRAGVPSS